MRTKFLLIALLFISLLGYSQDAPGRHTGGVVIGSFATDPATGKAGQIYWNSADLKFKKYNGTAWGNLVDLDIYDIGMGGYGTVSYTPIGGSTFGDHWLGLDTALKNLQNDVSLNDVKVTFPGFTSLLADYSFTDNSTNWNTAFGWGNHSSGGYSTGTHTTDTNTQLSIATSTEVNTGTNNIDAISPLALAGSQLQTDVSTTIGWGNHALGGYSTGSHTAGTNISLVPSGDNIVIASSTGAGATLLPATGGSSGLLTGDVLLDIINNNAKVTDDDDGVAEVYSASYDGKTEAVTKNDIYDKIESVVNDNGNQRVKISLSSAQLLNIFTTPIELIPSPGAGKVILIHKIVTKFDYGTTTYTSPTGLLVEYDGTALSTHGTSQLDDLSSSISNPTKTNAVMFENKSITFRNASANPTGGDGTMDVYMTYEIITL